MCASSSGHADVAAFLLENQGSIEQVVTGDTAVLSDGHVENGSLIIEQGESAGNDERFTSMTGSQLGPSTVAGALLGVDSSTLCSEPRNPELCGIVVPKYTPSFVPMDLLAMAFNGLRQIFELVDALQHQRLQNRKTYLRMMQIYVKLQSGPLRVNPTVHCIQATERFFEVINMFTRYLQKYHAMHRVKMENSLIEVVDEVDRLFQMLNIETVTEGHAVAVSNAMLLFSKLEDKHSEIRVTHDQIHTALQVVMLNPVGELTTEVTNPDMLANKTIELTELHEEEEKQSSDLIITGQGVGKDKLEPKIKPVVQAEEEMEADTTFSPLLSSPSLLDSSVPLLIKQLGSGEATTQETELTLLHLIGKCVSNSIRVQVYKAKGIPVLQDVVRGSKSWLAQLYALHCLSWFTFHFYKVRESEFAELQEYVRVPMQSQTLSLLHTLQYGNDQEKEVAALQCSCLATRGDGEILRQLKAFPLLIDLLTNGTANQKLWATEALVTLASDSDESCVEITSEGAIPPLIVLLRSGTDMQKQEAAYALGNLAANDATTRAKIASEGAIPPMVSFVKVDAQNQGAVYALGFLSLNNEENGVLIAQEGAIPPLVALLKTGTRSQKQWSAYTLGNLAYSDANRVEITEQGAIDPLIELLRSGTDMQKQRAVFALGNLACDNEVGSEFDEAILPLIELVRVGSDTQKEDAAYALGNLAASNDGRRDEIGRKGAIMPLVEPLRSGNDDQKQWAAFALRYVAYNNDENLVAILEEAVVPPLVECGTASSSGHESSIAGDTAVLPMDLLPMAYNGLRQILKLVNALQRQRLQNRKTYLRMMQIYVKLQSRPLRVNPTVHCIQAAERFFGVINMFMRYLQMYHVLAYMYLNGANMHRVLRVVEWVKLEDSLIEVVDEVDRLFQMLNIEVSTEVPVAAVSNDMLLFSKLEDKHSEIRVTHDQIHTALQVVMLNPVGEQTTEVTNPDMLANKTIELTELHEEEEKQSSDLIITGQGAGKDKLEPKIKPVVQAEEEMEVDTTFSPLLSSPSLLGDSSVPLLTKQLGSGEATAQETALKDLTEDHRNDFGTERLMISLMDYQRAGIASQTSNVPGCLKPQRMEPLFHKLEGTRGQKGNVG